ncbi:hypothetical protein [Pseudonocardia acidicola]|uniref:Uncharacterized protein n=1 Tax=Pseudonocardia acidicola TaxID=2724939 RepID=A0ABX1S8B2_9PSEU|nr:hypothetical protein [Pseudonocardia acidicola]NMH96616.1 hypothetical protein [Pseudonocardia acidicola]
MTASTTATGPGAKIDTEFVRHWSERYPITSDRRVLDEIGPAVAARGHYTMDELLVVGRWKATRATGYMRRNTAEDVEAITRLGLTAPDHLAHRVLRLLAGVLDPMASALLTVVHPDRFTVIDVLAIKTLRAHGELDTWPSYPAYLQLCRELANRTGADLRTLDRALWKWGKDH